MFSKKSELLIAKIKRPTKKIKKILDINNFFEHQDFFYRTIKVDEKYNKIINFQNSLLLPIYITNKVPVNTFSIPINIQYTNIPILTTIHEQIVNQDNKFIKTFTQSQQLIFSQMEGKWYKFFKKFVKIKLIFDTLYKFRVKRKKYIFNNINGKCKQISNEKIYDIIEFSKKNFNISSNTLWDILLKFTIYNPCVKNEEIIIQNNTYFFNETSFKLTNWIGTFTREFIDEENNLCWELNINGRNAILNNYDLCSAKNFQKAILRYGLFLFYGTDHELKKMLEFIFSNTN